VLAAAKPVEVSIPKIGVTSRLERLGTVQDGTMELPSDPAIAGWYTLGPTPGALGPAVIVGHVTWNRAPGVFFRLGALRPGDLVRVARKDGTDAVFAVSRIARFDKAHFPTQAVFGGIDHAGLRLITCGGAYDADAHRYLDNVVVFADLVDHSP
jgi:sortase (surface protein transpeptidase)